MMSDLIFQSGSTDSNTPDVINTTCANCMEWAQCEQSEDGFMVCSLVCEEELKARGRPNGELFAMDDASFD